MSARFWLLCALSVACFSHLCMALLLTWNRRRTPQLLPLLQPPSGWPSVLVVVPARNEGQNIEACVESLLAQHYPRLSVRVIDDHSTDDTARKVAVLCQRDRRLQLLHAPDLPPGWLGKPHALHFGTRSATEDYLLFIDADLRLMPEAVARAVATAEAQRAALLTVVPRLLAESFWERAVQPVVAMLLFSLLDPVRVMDPKSAFASANGPFLLFSRAGYQQIGGHAAVAGEIIEDLRLAEAVKRAGLRLSYCHGTDVARLRMYDSLHAVIAGWRKNFHAALGDSLWLAPLCCLLILWVFALPALGLLLSPLLYGLPGGGAILGLALLTYGADLAARMSLRRNYGITLRGSRLLGGVVVGYILGASAYRKQRGLPMSWRGRSVGTTPT